jgi:hypothetical protein
MNKFQGVLILEAIAKLIMAYFVQVSPWFVHVFWRNGNNVTCAYFLWLVQEQLMQFTYYLHSFQLILYALTVQDEKLDPKHPFVVII